MKFLAPLTLAIVLACSLSGCMGALYAVQAGAALVTIGKNVFDLDVSLYHKPTPAKETSSCPQ